MKSKILGVAMVLLPLFGFSQLGGSVVFDPTQAANMSTQISNTATQISQLEKSLEYMEKASATLEKVNSYVRDIEDLRSITKMYQESISYATKVRNNLNKIKNREMQQYYMKTVSNTLISLQNSIQFIQKIISNDFFKMSDKERMDMIKEERHKVVLKHSKLVALTL